MSMKQIGHVMKGRKNKGSGVIWLPDAAKRKVTGKLRKAVMNVPIIIAKMMHVHF